MKQKKQVQWPERGGSPKYFLPPENQEKIKARYDDIVRKKAESTEANRSKSNVTKEVKKLRENMEIGGDNHQEKRRKVPSVVSSADSIKSEGQNRYDY